MRSFVLFPTLAALLLAPVAAVQAQETTGEAASEEPQGAEPRNAFEVWRDEHRWVRLGFRAYGMLPSVDDHAALKLGAGVAVPLTLDLFMGAGMKISFLGSYNHGDNTSDGCINRGGTGTSAMCPDGYQGGVDFTWREPWTGDHDANGNPLVDGSDGDAVAGVDDMPPQRRESHVAFFALTIGGNYEVTIPTVKFFRVLQPFVGGGVVIAWIQTYSDLEASEFVLINNDQNDAYDSDNIDPWSSQGPEVGGEVYGGFHINLDEAFRFTLEVGYLKVDVPEAYLKKATDEDPNRHFEARHMAYTIEQFKFGGGFEFRF